MSIAKRETRGLAGVYRRTPRRCTRTGKTRRAKTDAYVHMEVQTHLPSHIPTYMHTFINTSTHTYIQADAYTHARTPARILLTIECRHRTRISPGAREPPKWLQWACQILRCCAGPWKNWSGVGDLAGDHELEWIHAYICRYVRTYLRTYPPTCIHTYIFAHIRTYGPT